MSIRIGLLVLIGTTVVAFALLWLRDLARRRAQGSTETALPAPVEIAIGFVTNFFDTLGIGSFATTTAAFKALHLVPDENIPGTMIIGHAIPAMTQALIFIAVVKVDPTALLALMLATALGGWFGAGVCTRLPRRPIQIGMGTGLLLAAGFMTMTQLGIFPGGGTAIGLSTEKLIVAVVLFALFGSLLMIGIGNYAPSLIVLSIMGMSPRAAFPVMMGSASMVIAGGGTRFMSRNRYSVRAALGLTIGGVPGVLIAGLIVKSLPLSVLRWVVVAVVIYAAVEMLRSAYRERAITAVNPQPA